MDRIILDYPSKRWKRNKAPSRMSIMAIVAICLLYGLMAWIEQLPYY